MERPFDYPGSQSDIMRPSSYDLKSETSWLKCDEDGEGTTRYAIYQYPDWWTDEDMIAMVHDRLPEERCQHSYDCCGRSYARRARPTKITSYLDGLSRVFVEQHFIINI